MTNNSTIVSANSIEMLWVSVVYAAQGVVIGGSNLFVVFVVFYFKALREAKEYLVILSLSLADGCNMLGNVVGGIRRVYLIATGKYSAMMTPWDCMKTSQNIIWSFTEILSGLVLLTVSVDRLLCVTFPLRYVKWSTSYAMVLFGITYMYSLVTGTLMSLVFVYQTNHLNTCVSAMCYSGPLEKQGVNFYYGNYRSYAAVIFATASIAVYGLTWVLYNKHENKVATTQTTDTNKRQSLRRQRRLTRSLGISCLCTIFVFMIPYGLGYFLHGIIPTSIVYFLFVLAGFNPFCNIFIYYVNQPEMKEAFKAFFTRKIMPGNLDQWKANNKAKNSRKRRQTNQPTIGNIATTAQL